MQIKSISADPSVLHRKSATKNVHLPDSVANGLSHVAGYRLDLISDPRPLARQWQAFEQIAIGSLFQSYRWVSSWLRTAAAANNEQPLIVTAFDAAGQLAFILPLAAVAKPQGKSSAATLTWLGSTQTSYNLGLFRPDIMVALTREGLTAIIDHIFGLHPQLEAVKFTNQPLTWEGIANPFALLPQHPAHGSSFELQLQEDFNAIYEEKFSSRSRSTIRRKQRQLAKEGELHIENAASEDQRLKIYEIFTNQKAAQFAEQGIANFLDDAVTSAFYLDLATGNDTGPVFEQSFVRVGDQVAATFNGFKFKDRFYFIQTSMTLDSLRKWSPGLLLMKENIAWSCDRGLKYFDLGPGQGSHKAAWHGNEIKMFDTYFSLRASGLPNTLGRIAGARATNFAKSNDGIASVARRLRKIIRLVKVKFGR